MREVNGKIWIENVDRYVKDVSQLDLKTYRIPARLMQVGGNLEIGPGLSNKNEGDDTELADEEISKYVNGIYCTNLTMEQVMEQVSYVYGDKKSEERTTVEKEPEEVYMEELEKSAKSKVDSLVASIYRISKNYRMGKTHLYMGVPIGESLDHLVADYNNNVVPEFATLSNEEKEELVEKLQCLLDNGLFRIERDFVTNAIERISALLNLPKEGSTTIKK